MLINCAAYKNGRKIGDIPVEKISDYVGRPDCFVWVGLADPTELELMTMQKEFGLHELAVEDAKNGHQRPKIDEYGDSLFVVLRTIELDDQAEMTLGEVNIFAGRNYILSIRNNSTMGFANVRKRCEGEPRLLKNGSAFVLYAILDSVVDRYFPIVDAFEQQLERIEEGIFSKASSARLNIEEVYALKQKLVTLQHVTGPLIEAIAKLYGGRVPDICVSMQEYFRDIADHVARINKTIDTIREMSTTVIQVNLSLISLSESEVTKKLAAYGALFAFPTAIAGIYGMNFKFMPELEWKWGYLTVLILMVVTDVVFWFRFKKAKWV